MSYSIDYNKILQNAREYVKTIEIEPDENGDIHIPMPKGSIGEYMFGGIPLAQAISELGYKAEYNSLNNVVTGYKL